jgi:hypothetical protein
MAVPLLPGLSPPWTAPPSNWLPSLYNCLFFRVKVTLRLTVYRQSFLLRLTTTNFIFQLNPCGHSPYVPSTLTRGWVCRLQLLLVLASAVILGSESRGTHDHVLLSQIRDWRARFPCLYPQEQGGPVIPPGTGLPFRRLIRLAGLRWRHWTPSFDLHITPFVRTE